MPRRTPPTITPNRTINPFIDVSEPIRENYFTDIYRTKLEKIGREESDTPKSPIYLASAAFQYQISKWIGMKSGTSIPVINPLFIREEIKSAKLIIFPGGEDIDPRLYNEKNTFSETYGSSRDNIERAVFDAAQNSKVKLLGICRGLQLLNVLLGGTLYQDLYFDHKRGHPYNHPLDNIKKDSFVNMFKVVNSMHHQGIRIPFSESHMTSSFDGIFESFETENIVAVQFHPEFLMNKEADEFKNKILNWAKVEL